MSMDCPRVMVEGVGRAWGIWRLASNHGYWKEERSGKGRSVEKLTVYCLEGGMINLCK